MGRPSKSGSGGARTGTPGNVYPLRTDLNTNRTPTTAAPFVGQPYGTGVQQAAVAGAAQPAGVPQGQLVPTGVPAPGQFPHLLAPTDRPDEPVTAGLPFGAGPNTLPQPFQSDPLVTAAALLANLPAIHQTPALQALLAATRGSVANSSGPSVTQ